MLSSPATRFWWPSELAGHPEKTIRPGEIFQHLVHSLKADWSSATPVEFATFSNTVIYSPIPYLPQALAIALSKAIGLAPLPMLYLGRLASCLVSLFITVMAVRAFPGWRWSVVLVALLPMSLSLRSSLSADQLTIALAFLLLGRALSLRQKMVTESPSHRDIVELFILSGLLSLCKQAYLFIPWVVPILLWDRWKNGRMKWIVSTGIPLTTIALSGGWTLAVRELYVPARTDGISPAGQLQFLLSHPLRFLKIAWGELRQNGGEYRNTMMGSLGWLDTRLPGWAYRVLPWTLALSWALVPREQTPIRFSLSQRISAAMLAAGSILLIVLLLYLSWTPVGADHVEGIQGRYFLPLIPLLHIAVPQWRLDWLPESALSKTWLFSSMTFGAIAIFAVLRRYYGLSV